MAVRKRIGEMLLDAGIIDQAQLQAALGHQRKWGGRLGQALVDLKLVTEAQIVEALSRKFGYEAVKLAGLEEGPVLDSALKLVPREFASRNNVLPYAVDTSSVSVAMSDPGNIAIVDEIRFRTGRRVKVALAGDREIAAAVRRHYYGGESHPEVEAIPLEFEGEAQEETVVEQFGGGSTEALDQFFARPGAAPPAAAPSTRAVAASPPPSVAAPGTVELEDSLTPAPRPLPPVQPVRRAPGGAAAEGPREAAPRAVPAAAGPAPAPPAASGEAAEKSGTFELPLDAEIPPDALQDPWSRGPVEPADRGAAGRGAGQDREIELLSAIEQLAQGDAVPPQIVKPSQLAAALVRLLIRKRIISFEELLDEFGKK